jgi:hypothetical protein
MKVEFHKCKLLPMFLYVSSLHREVRLFASSFILIKEMSVRQPQRHFELRLQNIQYPRLKYSFSHFIV